MMVRNDEEIVCYSCGYTKYAPKYTPTYSRPFIIRNPKTFIRRNPKLARRMEYVERLIKWFELPESVRKEAELILQKYNHISHINTPGIAGLATLIASRNLGVNLSPTQISNYVGHKNLWRAIKKTGLKLDKPSSRITKYIEYICDKLKLPENVKNLAKHIAERSIPAKPTTIAASAVYLACKNSGRKITQDEITEILGIGKATISIYQRRLKDSIL
ncbi:MAG: hypothetical protein ACP5IZ_11120 [Thermoprotei archaeon]|jgi:transcription initiation factor TFIIIB Brf1 subunit/transcription initiation factor TFIIB